MVAGQARSTSATRAVGASASTSWGTAAPRSRRSSPRSSSCRRRTGPSPTCARSWAPTCASGSTRSPSRRIRYSTFKSYGRSSKAPRPGPRPHPARQAHPGRCPGVPERASRRRACRLAGSSTSTPSCAGRSGPPSAGAWSAATSPSSSTRHGSARHEITPADPGAGAPAHRDLRRGPLPGALDHGARAPASGRASSWPCAGRTSTSRPGACRVRHTLANVDGTLTLLEPKTDRSRRLVVLPEVGRRGAAGPSDPPEDGPPGGRVTLDRQRSRVRDDAGQAASRRDDHPCLPGRPRSRRACPTSASTTCATPRRRSSCPRASTLEDVKNLLGHSTIVLTSNTYGHVLEQRQRQVARGMDAVLGG